MSITLFMKKLLFAVAIVLLVVFVSAKNHSGSVKNMGADTPRMKQY